jgi:diguanylate cyclase (GGDEF)-like protein
MSELIDQLTRLTRLRDGDVLDMALADLTCDLLRSAHVAIHRLVADRGETRWVTTAMAGQKPRRRAASVAPGEPRFEGHRDWLACLQRQEPLVLSRPVQRLLQPLAPLGDPAAGVMEIHGGGAADAEQQRMVVSLLRFYGQLRDLINENERDSLTGLLNRKSFDECFVRAAQGLPMPGQPDERLDPWWLGLVDIDHFKAVNDNFGHLIGDEVLLLVAQQMRRCFRFGDRLYRFGGEEFVVLLRAADAEQAHAAFDRLRAQIEAFDFPQVCRLTVSIGYAPVEADDTPSSAFARADQAVYAAKQAGRNRTLAYADTAAQSAGTAAPAFGVVEYF